MKKLIILLAVLINLIPCGNVFAESNSATVMISFYIEKPCEIRKDKLDLDRESLLKNLDVQEIIQNNQKIMMKTVVMK